MAKRTNKKFVSLVRTAFPDQQYTINSLISEGDWLLVLYTFRGTFTGKFKDFAPTGNKVTLPGVGTYHFAGDKVVEIWGTHEMLSMMQQMGVVPASATKN